jgi:hypothetical protein
VDPPQGSQREVCEEGGALLAVAKLRRLVLRVKPSGVGHFQRLDDRVDLLTRVVNLSVRSALSLAVAITVKAYNLVDLVDLTKHSTLGDHRGRHLFGLGPGNPKQSTELVELDVLVDLGKKVLGDGRSMSMF